MAAKRTIGILTGGGDVPGLNPAIRAVTLRAEKEGSRVIGIRRGWAGLVDLVRDAEADNRDNYITLSTAIVMRQHRSGGTFLHSSRTNPSTIPASALPDHLKQKYTAAVNDVTSEVLENLAYLGIDTLIAIGGDDTLSYAHHLHKHGFQVVAIPKTMDNDVQGTDYCIGFGTCVSRTIDFTNQLRTSAGSHERIMIIEVFGRYAGFTAMLPTIAGAADRCIIPEHPFNISRLTELLVADRQINPSKYAVALISEGASFAGPYESMVFTDQHTDMYGHKKLGGIGDCVASRIKEISPQFNKGKQVNIISQRLGYLVRSGTPDFLDSVVPVAFGNLALDLILQGTSGRLVALRTGRYGDVPLDIVVSKSKVVDVDHFYNTDRYRPHYKGVAGLPTFIMGCNL